MVEPDLNPQVLALPFITGDNAGAKFVMLNTLSYAQSRFTHNPDEQAIAQ